MQQNGVFDLLKLLEMTLDEALPLIPGRFAVVKPKEIELLIDRIYGALPMEVQEAKALLRRREELQAEAQQKAEKILKDAHFEAERKLSEADFIKALEREGIRIRTQVQQECEEIKRRAVEEAETIKLNATEEAMKTREGSEIYAEQILTNLERDLTQLQQVVKNGQIHMERLRGESSFPGGAYAQDKDTAGNFVIR
jgi:cell division septum initiation protein DivIVA